MSDMYENNIELIELSIEEAKKIIATKNSVDRLISNRDFKKVFTEGYLTNEAARLAGLSADPQTIEHREEIFSAIQSISHVQQYLRNLRQFGMIAERDMHENQELLDETRAEEELA